MKSLVIPQWIPTHKKMISQIKRVFKHPLYLWPTAPVQNARYHFGHAPRSKIFQYTGITLSELGTLYALDRATERTRRVLETLGTMDGTRNLTGGLVAAREIANESQGEEMENLNVLLSLLFFLGLGSSLLHYASSKKQRVQLRVRNSNQAGSQSRREY